MDKDRLPVQNSFDIPSELNRKFRNAIAKKFGWKKGNLSRAINEAITDWIKKVNNAEKGR